MKQMYKKHFSRLKMVIGVQNYLNSGVQTVQGKDEDCF